MTDTVIRHLHMMQAMPLNIWTSTADIHKRLQERGYSVSRRTVQRDLLKCARFFGLQHEQITASRDYIWRRIVSLEVTD